MIYVIIVIVGAILGVVHFIREDFADGVFEWTMTVIMGLFFGSVAGAVVSFLIGLTVSGITYTDDMHLEREYEIIALQDNMGTSGRAMLGSGQFDSEMKYVFMSQEEYGAQMQMINAENAAIKYSEQPKVEKFTNDFKSETMKKLFWGNMFAGVRYQIFVPEGTIQQNYNVDLK